MFYVRYPTFFLTFIMSFNETNAASTPLVTTSSDAATGTLNAAALATGAKEVKREERQVVYIDIKLPRS